MSKKVDLKTRLKKIGLNLLLLSEEYSGGINYGYIIYKGEKDPAEYNIPEEDFLDLDVKWKGEAEVVNYLCDHYDEVLQNILKRLEKR